MNYFCNAIDSMNLGPMQRLNVLSVLFGFNSAAIIHLYVNNDSSSAVRSLLQKTGIHSISVDISKGKNHVQTLAIGKTTVVTNELRMALASKNETIARRLLGERITLPVQVVEKSTKLFTFFTYVRDNAPLLYDELLIAKKVPVL